MNEEPIMTDKEKTKDIHPHACAERSHYFPEAWFIWHISREEQRRLFINTFAPATVVRILLGTGITEDEAWHRAVWRVNSSKRISETTPGVNNEANS